MGLSLSQPVHAEGDGEGENPLLHVDEAVMGLSVHTNGDGAGENPLLQRSLFVVATCKLVLN